MKQRSLLAFAVTALAVASSFGFQASATGELPLVFADTLGNQAEFIQSKRDRMLAINDQCNNIAATCEAEGREMTDEERRDFDGLMSEFNNLDADVKRFEANAERNQMINSGNVGGRQVDPSNEPTQDPTPAARPAAAATNATRAQMQASGGRRASVPAEPRDNRDAGRWGFMNFGQYLGAVRAASRQGGPVDPRLITNAPTTYGQEGVGSDGGFAVPPDFRTAIQSKVLGEDSLLSRTDQMTTSSNAITLPVDETTPWQSSGGIQAYWEKEGGQKTQSKPLLGELTVKAHKVIALVPMTDELLQDAPAMASYVNRKAPEKIDFKVNEAILKGTGAGQPLGILNSPGTIVVPAEAGQTADTVIYENISKMYYRMNAASRRKAVWLVNGDAEEQFGVMKFPGQGNGNALPVFLPPGGLSASPYATLFGRPIIPVETTAALGDQGDIVFADLSAYMSLVKAGGVRQDVSIHLFFDYDMTAFRFVLRVGGQPWWNSPIERAAGSSRGFFTTLAPRA